MSILDELDPQLETNPLPFHCERHHRFAPSCTSCAKAKTAYWQERVGKQPQLVLATPSASLAVVHEAPATEGKPTTVTDSRSDNLVPAVVARLSDPQSSHLAAAKIPTQKLWERMITIRNLVLAHPGQCIREYVNFLTEQIPVPELDAPGCRDSVGAPKHDVGFYGVWATLFAQAEKHGLILKVTDPQTPTEKLMKKSPYPGESMVHVYKACTPADMQCMERERKACFERLGAQKAANRELRASAVAQQRLAKKVATFEDNQTEPQFVVEPGRSA